MIAMHTSIGDRTGVAMAEALQRNTSLQSFTMYAGNTSIGDRTGVAMAEALQRNTSLLKFNVASCDERVVAECLARNGELLWQRRALRSLARQSMDTGLRSLTD